ncbi:hypothetical protein MNEG_14842 [Monoraphidium neglectum]|uniref:Ion transport domain-containing protein n=1 Tax=Monoraphidium neglectum TaxID=145388 RepID=A0A0D2LU00_9CHLO|nr:hypothetical protein MNEG_14842 [Monoraphidium neglectum]KIY93121.1 hypothetical protein MNEG_14842 [Monoraphidium neglectum]|eukprot:XP_013892141.1 hypothetical protein MNEG_14842 [Monoraphidium neglectum]
MTRGTLYVTDTPPDKSRNTGPMAAEGSQGDPNVGAFSNIAWGMMSLINLGLGLGLWEYGYICNLDYEVTSAFCTIYYLAYMATSVNLLLNLLTAMIIRTYNASQKEAESHWRRRWATWVQRSGRGGLK